MFNFIDIYNFIPVSGCVCMGPSALLFPGAYNAVKMDLQIVFGRSSKYLLLTRRDVTVTLFFQNFDLMLR